MNIIIQTFPEMENWMFLILSGWPLDIVDNFYTSLQMDLILRNAARLEKRREKIYDADKI